MISRPSRSIRIPDLASPSPCRSTSSPVVIVPAASDSAARRDDLVAFYHELSDCQKCPLAGGAQQVVFGTGDPDADLMFVGEAPGFNEDKQGKPFVGQAGKLLDKLLAEIGLERGQCFIANVLKCRPPGNRDPQPARDRGLRRAPVQADRADPAAGGLLARQLRHEAALRAAGGHHEGARSPAGARARAGARSSCTRSSIQRQPSTRRRCWSGCAGTSRRCRTC